MTTATRGQGLVKNDFIFYLRISQLSTPVQGAYRSQNLLKLNKKLCTASLQFQMKKRKITRRRSRSPKYAELGHFTLMCRVRHREGKEMYKDL